VVTAIGVAAHCHVLRSIADAAILCHTRNRTTKDAAIRPAPGYYEQVQDVTLEFKSEASIFK
jgi:hypothetical protein